MRTEHGDLRAELIVRATEGFTPSLQGQRRSAGAGLLADDRHRAAAGADSGSEIGLAERETFTDFRHLIIYGQRTADDRLVFGGRGAPYHFGSRIAPGYDRVPAVFAALRATLAELLPALAERRISHRWGGPLGIAGTGTPRSAWTAPPGWPGPAATSATGCRPPTWPAGRWPT